MFTQTTQTSSALGSHLRDVFAGSPMLMNMDQKYNMWKAQIADTFSRLLCSDLSSPLVGQKDANVISNSESDSRNESSHSLLMDDRDITDCLMNLSCLPSRKKKEGKPTKRRKCSETMLSHIYDSIIEQCYLNLPEDIIEDNPLDLENIKERQDRDEKLMQSTVKHPEWHSHKTINDVENILGHTKPGDNPANWKIALPEDLIYCQVVSLGYWTSRKQEASWIIMTKILS
jgi:hypothetical protein